MTNVGGLDLDVIFIGIDSTSRMMWKRKLPKTRDYFLKTLKGIEFETYNIVGDGTPPALLPLLTGKREEELPEARRGEPNASYVDSFPWIWRRFADAGYVTVWAEEEPQMGTFQNRLLVCSVQFDLLLACIALNDFLLANSALNDFLLVYSALNDFLLVYRALNDFLLVYRALNDFLMALKTLYLIGLQRSILLVAGLHCSKRLLVG
ncbi:hypothetical protein Bpfe_004876 [Biomphalaria pfeifferi]|uniref:Uncharacterized protein n=1 Tax=Biomphalaria pfeifferi TaxID=112525 RepID=A0AAD8C396_BIOPF|nr:hypothetical protein Bpfe_004876 [Biomphalaria pfeifferi]